MMIQRDGILMRALAYAPAASLAPRSRLAALAWFMAKGLGRGSGGRGGRGSGGGGGGMEGRLATFTLLAPAARARASFKLYY